MGAACLMGGQPSDSSGGDDPGVALHGIQRRGGGFNCRGAVQGRTAGEWLTWMEVPAPAFV